MGQERTKILESNSKSYKPAHSGVLILAMKDLFDKIKHIEDSQKALVDKKLFIIKISYIEIYNEQVYDLLQDGINE